jgi:hypothetical protein
MSLQQPTATRAYTGGFTGRAIILALLLLPLLIVVGYYATIVYKPDDYLCSVPAAAQLHILILLTGVGVLPLLRRWGLTRQELLAIYSILLVAAPVMGRGILYWLIPKSIVYYYLARANPAWEEELLPLVPSWFAPSDPAAVEGFFLGKASVPWSLWLMPMAAWLSFAVALYVAVASLLSILQQQWIRHERLAYPLTQIPLEILSDSTGEDSPGKLTTSRMLWLGVVISFGTNLVSELSTKFPSIPQLPLGPVQIIPWQRVGPLAGLGAYELVLWPWLIALAYLIPKELSFSCWFFWLIRVGLTVIAIAAGATAMRPEDWWSPTFPAPYYQGTGAILALGIWLFWSARKHLARVVKIALSRQLKGADAEDPLPYRTALLAFLAACVWLVWFFRLAGCRWGFGFVIVFFLLSLYLMWARLRAETGMGLLAFPLDIGSLMRDLLGTSALRPQELVAVSSARWAGASGEGMSFDTVTANLAETFKIADAAGLNQRRLMIVSFCALFGALLFGTYVTLAGTYHFGYFGTAIGNAPYFPALQTKMDAAAIYTSLQTPTLATIDGLVAIAVGAMFTVLLGLMRLRFYWWPFHPIGYLAANCWGWNWYLTPFFLGWVGKIFVIRYGGLRLYRQTVPFAVGFIIGDVMNQLVWIVVTLADHVPILVEG